jgi:ribosomal protein S18 acetylase RimI-like enzyme
MPEAANYSAVEFLRNGREVEIRALKPDDHACLLAAIERTSTESLYRRFFSVKRYFSETEQTFFLSIDFRTHVALVALVEENGQPAIVGGGRYVVARPGSAAVAFAIIDDYQRLGIGAALLRHLIVLAREAGLKELIAEVLPENRPMLKVFEKSGLAIDSKREGGVVHVALRLNN